MKNTGTLKVTTPTGREIVLTRVFDATRSMVWDAFTKRSQNKFQDLYSPTATCFAIDGRRGEPAPRPPRIDLEEHKA